MDFLYSKRDCDYYIKEVDDKDENDNIIKINIFYVNRNVPLTDEILEKMVKYDFVEFCYDFNQSVDNLSVFNQEIGKKGLKSLTFGNNFNQSVDNLPSGLEELVLGDNFNQSVDNLPSGLQELTISKNYDKPLDKLSPSVKVSKR